MFEYKYKNLYIKAVSIGGVETCYILPHFDIAFDAGKCPDPLIDISRLFITHGHLDHTSGVPYYISQRSLRGLPGPDIYLPKKLRSPMKDILKKWNKIEGYKAKCNLIPMQWNDKIQINKNYYVQAIPSFHRIPCNGYILFEKVVKLKKECLGLPSNEIVRLKKQGKDIFHKVDNPVFAFSGDSTIEFVLENEAVRRSKVLFMECTYIDQKRPVKRAREWGHTHLDEIIHYKDYFQNERLVLVHFSKRYGSKNIQKTLKAKLPDALKNKVDILYKIQPIA